MMVFQNMWHGAPLPLAPRYKTRKHVLLSRSYLRFSAAVSVLLP